MGRPKVRMRDDDSFQSALPVDEVQRGVVEPGDQVPEHVAVLRFQEDGALPDAELLGGGGGVAQAGGHGGVRGRDGLGGDEVDAGVVLVRREFVLLRRRRRFVVQRGPGLTCGGHVLAGVVADGAVGGWGGEGDVELRAAGEADGEIAAGVVHFRGIGKGRLGNWGGGWGVEVEVVLRIVV